MLKHKAVTVLFLSLITFSGIGFGCKPEGCTEPNSDNYDPEAETDNGECIPSRDKFMGNYNAAEVCPTGSFVYVAVIDTSLASDTTLLISNFADLNIAVRAEVFRSDFTIPRQQFNISSDNVFVSGTGGIDGGQITINYTLERPARTEGCTINLVKQ
jgi:hypothetical protein